MAQHAALQPAGSHPDAAPALRTAWMPAGFLVVESAGPMDGPAAWLVGGIPLLPPFARLGVAGGSILLARASAACAMGADLVLRREGCAPLRLTLDAPADPAALLRDRPEAERLALLRALIAAGPAFRARSDAGFGGLCHALAAPLATGRRAAAIAGGEGLALWRLPRSVLAPGDWHLLAPDAPLRAVGAPTADGLLLLEGVPALLLPPEGAPIRLAAVAGVPSLLALARRGGALRAALLDLLALRARQGGASAALLRDLQLLAPARMVALDDPALPVGGALELALPDCEGGVFLRGWLRDPLGLVRTLALRGPGGSVPLPLDALHRLPRPDLAERLRRAPQGDGGPRPGFVAHLAQTGLPPGTAQLALELRLASGQCLTLVAPPGLLPPAAARDLVLGAAEADAALLDCIAPAVARLHRAALAPGTPPERVGFGIAPTGPPARIVVPLWRNLSFLRAQLAGFARDPAFRGAAAPDLVYVLDSPEQHEEARALLGGLALLHGLPLTLLVHDRNRGYASACNTGAEGATAPLLVFLNSDVVPDAPGWLGALRRRLSRDARLAAVGPKLLYPDGAIQHAGLFFAPNAEGGWGSNHYHKGWPRQHPPACRARRVPAITGAAFAVRRAAFEAVGGFCTDYVLGDFEDSDLCLKLHAAGHAIAYEPAAVLIHHERQSIAAHPGHAGTLAAAYNRRLQDARWGDDIAGLMRRHAPRRG